MCVFGKQSYKVLYIYKFRFQTRSGGFRLCHVLRENITEMSKLIHELPWKVRFNLSLLLDQLEPPNHSWKALIGELDNLTISNIEVNAVERQGQIPGKSPTEVLLNTLEHKNYTIDDIYRGLHKMEHRRAMDIISKYGVRMRIIF